MVDLVTREQWGALPPKRGTRQNLESKYLIAHHSVYPTWMDPLEQIRTIQRQHLNDPVNDYNDIGYSILVDAWGKAYEGRGWFVSHGANGIISTTLGRSLSVSNSNSRSICFMGRGDEITAEAKTTIRELVADAEQLFGSQRRLGHRDVYATGCPGDVYFDWFKAPFSEQPQPKTDPIEEAEVQQFAVRPVTDGPLAGRWVKVRPEDGGRKLRLWYGTWLGVPTDSVVSAFGTAVLDVAKAVGKTSLSGDVFVSQVGRGTFIVSDGDGDYAFEVAS